MNISVEDIAGKTYNVVAQSGTTLEELKEFITNYPSITMGAAELTLKITPAPVEPTLRDDPYEEYIEDRMRKAESIKFFMIRERKVIRRNQINMLLCKKCRAIFDLHPSLLFDSEVFMEELAQQDYSVRNAKMCFVDNVQAVLYSSQCADYNVLDELMLR